MGARHVVTTPHLPLCQANEGAVRLLLRLSCSTTGAPDVGAATCPLNGAIACGAGGMGRGSISTPFQGVPITQH